MVGGSLYLIFEGVRRAKAAEMAGATTIRGEILLLRKASLAD